MTADDNQETVIRASINAYLEELSPRLLELNHSIHKNPELAYEEHHAHDAICTFLEELGFKVTRHAYGLATSFECISGSEDGRMINFNAEYDALPDLGHACGHNLIATAGVAGFLGLSHAIEKFGIKGRAQLLGTPAEEDGGGKVDLVKAGAYEKPSVSLMMHPVSDDEWTPRGLIGCGGKTSIACYDVVCTYRGVSSHAGIAPWEGVNALDALVSAYNNISMLRQQIKPDQRIHGAIMEAPKVTNAVPAYTVTKYTIRSPTIQGTKELGERVRRCIEAGALATGCTVEVEETAMYADLRLNDSLCEAFQSQMGALGHKIERVNNELFPGSTDQGNVTYAVPGLHAIIGIPVADGSHNHTFGFTAAAATQEAHDITVDSGKAMAMTGWQLICDDALYDRVRDDYEKDKLLW